LSQKALVAEPVVCVQCDETILGQELRVVDLKSEFCGEFEY
jgi:hypothetical protein